MATPLLSVIIPTHNRAALVGATVASVLAQPRACQVIVVDDASTDGTADAVERDFGGRVTVVRLPANGGPGAARNAGLAVADGAYAAFLDSDDLWLPWTADAYAAAIDRHGRPAFVAGKPAVFDGDVPDVPGGEPLTTLAFADYLAGGDQWRWFSASSFVMRADLLRAAGGFTDEWVNAEDADVALRMGTAGPFVQVTGPATFAWRRHAGSAMAATARTVAGVRRLIDVERAGGYPGGPGRARDRRRIIATHVRPLSLDLIRNGNPSAGWDLYRQTLGWHLSLGRWRYLAGFPARALLRR